MGGATLLLLFSGGTVLTPTLCGINSAAINEFAVNECAVELIPFEAGDFVVHLAAQRRKREYQAAARTTEIQAQKYQP